MTTYLLICFDVAVVIFLLRSTLSILDRKTPSARLTHEIEEGDFLKFTEVATCRSQRLKSWLMMQSPVVAASGKSLPWRTDKLVDVGCVGLLP